MAAGIAFGFLLLGASEHRSSPPTAGVAHDFSTLPIGFQPNRGQSPGPVRFLSTGPGFGLFLTRDRAVLALRSPGQAAASGSALSMKLVGASPHPQISGQDRLPGHINYISGAPGRSRTGIPSFGAVTYSAVWPGIGVRFYGSHQRFEYDLRLAPGANAGEIGLRFAGQRSLRIDDSGGLALHLDGQTIYEQRPVAYQLVAGVRHPVSSHYVLRHGEVGVALGAHDSSRAVTIDPQLVYSTYVGRGGGASSIAVDGSGSVYITGTTQDPRFPTTAGSFQTHFRSERVAFVTKLGPSGRHLVYSTFLGGGEGSSGRAIAVDQAGDAYVTGLAYAPGFPVTPGAFQVHSSSDVAANAFVAKLDPSGSRLLYSTYLGGSGTYGSAKANALAIDREGNAYVAGATSSEDFPVTPGAAETINPRTPSTFQEDGFVTKLDPTGSHLLYSTYLGGSTGNDDANGIAIDKAGDAYVTGQAESKDFPTTPGAFQRTLHARGDAGDAFVTKIDPAGTRFVYSTYLGGKGLDWGSAIAVDGEGRAHVTGLASESDFPMTARAFRAKRGGFGSAFVTTLSPDGSGLLSSGLLGGRDGGSYTFSRGISLDRAGNTYVTGRTDSRRFPTTADALQPVDAGERPSPGKGYNGFNGFIARLDPTEHKLQYSTYLGGSDTRISSVTMDGAGDLYVAGATSTGLPGSRSVPRKSHRRPGPGRQYAFVTKLRP